MRASASVAIGEAGGEFVELPPHMAPAVGQPHRAALGQASRRPHSRRPAARLRTRRDARSVGRPCGRGRRRRRRRADRSRPRAGRRAHRPRAGRSWCARGPGSSTGAVVSSANSLPERFSVSSSRSCTGRSRKAARPTQSASVERSRRRPGGRRSAPGGRAAGGRRIWRRAPARPARRWAGRPRSAAPVPGPARTRPRRRGRRSAGGGSPAPGTAPAPRRGARTRPRRSGAGRPSSTGRRCCRCRRGVSTRGRWAGSAPRFVRRLPTPGRLLGRLGLLGGKARGLDLLGLLQPEQELVLGQALGPASEAVALHRQDDLAQPLVLGALLGEQRLERLGIVGRGRSRRGHEAD